jgi:hypothetical protein
MWFGQSFQKSLSELVSAFAGRSDDWEGYVAAAGIHRRIEVYPAAPIRFVARKFRRVVIPHAYTLAVLIVKWGALYTKRGGDIIGVLRQMRRCGGERENLWRLASRSTVPTW